ncbi:MAG: GatB/YqeY domain-containing protein [Romboutsia timonensis]
MLKEKLLEDLKIAMKEKDAITKNTIQMIRAAILQTEKDKQIELDDNGILEIISKQVKQKNDALEQFEKADRHDLIEQTESEINILKEYLPKQLNKEEVEQIVIDLSRTLGISDMKGMGTLIKSAKAKIGAGSDGKTISEVVKKVLNNG